MPERSVNCCVTSPPYFGLRDYGHEGQLGLEPTPDEYVKKMVEVFREVRRVLTDDGTLWLNIGDSYASYKDGKAVPDSTRGDSTGTAVPKGFVRNRMASSFEATAIKNKDLIGIPWMLAFALRADGWYLRQDIIWHKPNPMPESVTDRCTKAHEYVFLLSKSAKYFYDNEAIKEIAVCGSRGSEFHTGKTGEHQLGRSQKVRPSKKRGEFEGKNVLPGKEAFRAVVEMRNRRSVWSIATRPYKGAHFAVFPPDLIEPCVLAGCPVGGVVLDPFGGSGTTGGVALKHGRSAVLCELNPDYVDVMQQRIESIL